MRGNTGTGLGSNQRVLLIRQSLVDANRTESKPLSRGTPPKSREQMLKEMPPKRKEAAWIKWLWQNGYGIKKIIEMTGFDYGRVHGIASGKNAHTVEALRPNHLLDESGSCKPSTSD